MNELSREKNELEGRIEEDQDEIEELLEKQRSVYSQTSSLQSQLGETQLLLDEAVESKAGLESKVGVGGRECLCELKGVRIREFRTVGCTKYDHMV